jgi:hypothetical protein
LKADRQFQGLTIPKYTEGRSSESPTNLALNCLNFADDTPFIGDRVGTLFSNYTLYRNERAPNTSIVNFQVTQDIGNLGTDLSDAIFQVDFMEPADAEGYANVVVTKLDYVVATITDGLTTGYTVPEREVLPSSFLVYQGSCVFKRDVHWSYNADNLRLDFLVAPTDDTDPISPRIDPEVTIVYLVKSEQRTVRVRQGEDTLDIVPGVRVSIGLVTAGDVFNIRRSRTKNRAYDIYQGMGTYTLTLVGAAQTKPDAEKLMNFLLMELRKMRPRVAHYGLAMDQIQGSLQTEQEELDISGDMTKGFEITWQVKCQYQFMWPVPVQLFEVFNFVFESELSADYQPTPAPLEYLAFTEKFQ